VTFHSTVGETPLYLAAVKGNLDIIKMLHKHGASLNGNDDAKLSPLYIAAQKGFIDVVQYLVTNGADIERKVTDGATALLVSGTYIDLAENT
jgi:ankyrin repeat protein